MYHNDQGESLTAARPMVTVMGKKVCDSVSSAVLVPISGSPATRESILDDNPPQQQEGHCLHPSIYLVFAEQEFLSKIHELLQSFKTLSAFFCPIKD